MRRLLIGLLLSVLPTASLATPEALAAAIAALGARDYQAAASEQAQVTDPAAADVVTWIRLRQGEGELSEYFDFLSRNADWPGLPYLIHMGERNLSEDTPPATVIAYFADQAPRTGWGSLRLAAALWESDRREEAMAEAIRAWTTMSLSEEEHDQFMIDWPRTLRRFHEARLDHLLWQGEASQAERMFPLVSEGWQSLAQARTLLRARRPGVNAAIDAVPSSLRDDPGLAYERFVWRMREGLWESAGELIRERSGSAAQLGRPSEWADRRRIMARDLMRDGDLRGAYEIAANHHIDPDEDYLNYSDLEWLAGYTALRLGDAATAAEHFSHFRASVESPISMGRAGYWLGRAQEALGNSDAAAQAYAMGARFQSSFYGQLAAERGGLPTDPAFLGQEDFGDWRMAEFVSTTVFRAAVRLLEAGEIDLAERFWTHLTESLPRQQAGQLADMALELGEPHIALMIAKRTAGYGNEIMRAYYPLSTELLAYDLPVSDRLVHSIARRESEFDPTVVSHAGALGLMQVMPRTGREMARRLGVAFSESRMHDDPAFNATLGAEYLNLLIEEFGPNPVLIAAAYNAGPSRAERWMELYGDPRDPSVDVVDWIEAIPFRETRNYVMRVTESMRIYDALLSGQLPDQSLSELLRQR